MDTKYQKLYYGDVVRTTESSHVRNKGHVGHFGTVIGTMVIYKEGRKLDRTYYDVACECGRTFRSVAWVLEYIQSPEVDYLFPSSQITISEIRMRIFLRLMGVEESRVAVRDWVLQKQVEIRLAPLNEFENEIIRRRYGMTPSGEQERLQAIGDDHSLTRERIRQIEARALRKIRYCDKLRQAG